MKNIILGLTAASLCILTPLPAFAGSFEDAVKAHDTKDYKTAFSIFTKLADENHAGAQFYLGHMYRHGESVKKSKKKTAKWMQKAVAQGNDDARVTLGGLYRFGEGVPKSEEKAFALYKLASDGDHIAGRHKLAGMYRWGYGIEEDKQKAFNLYSQVNRMGGINSHLFYISDSDSSDEIFLLKKKYGWLKETITAKQAAAMKIEEEKQLEIQRIYVAKKAARFKDDALAAGPIENGWSAYSAKDYKRAFPILLAHANNGDVEAQTRVGVMYRDGLGVTPSDSTAGQWFEKAEKGDSGEAYYHHAMLKFWGRYQGACCLMAEGLMKRSYRLGYQPAIDRFNRKEAEKDRIARLQQERLQKEAEEAARRAEWLRKNPRRTITNCDGPRPGDAPPVPTGYTCDRRSGSPTYGDYVRKK